MSVTHAGSGKPQGSDQDTWTAVDDYFCSTLVTADSTLTDVERASQTAGLPAISVSAPQGKLLHLLVRSVRAHRVLEIGTLGGHSAVWMARAMRRPGQLVTLELDPRHAQVARENINHAGVGDLVNILVGPAADSLQALLNERPEPFDVVFIDADKASNSVYLDYAVRLGHPGTIIVVDNVVRGGRVLTATDDASIGVRHLVDQLANRTDVDSVAIQTVGSRGYDGFILAVVTDNTHR